MHAVLSLLQSLSLASLLCLQESYLKSGPENTRMSEASSFCIITGHTLSCNSDFCFHKFLGSLFSGSSRVRADLELLIAEYAAQSFCLGNMCYSYGIYNHMNEYSA